MSGDDITFRVDLDISRAEAKLSELDNDINNTLSKTSNNDGDFAMADAVFARNVSRSAHQENNSKFTFAIDKFSNAVDRLKDKFRNVGTGKKGDGETNYEFLKMKHDSGRAVDVLDDEGGMTEAVFNRIVHEQARLDSIKKIEAVDAGEFGAYDLSKGWSQEGSDAYTKFRLMQERAMAKKEMKLYDDMGYEDGARGAAERFAKADGALRADRLSKKTEAEDVKQDEITDETKQQNREYTEQIFKLGKVFAILSAIKAVLAAAAKLARAVVGTVKETTENTKEMYSLLTYDPLGSAKGSTDRLNAMMLRGMKNLGADSPFSKDDWLGFLTTIQTTKEDALTGKVNSDMAIAFQWLTKLGTGFNAEQLLTGDPSRSNAEIAKQMADAIEKALSSDAFWNQDEITRSQTLKYLRTALGEGVINGLWYNAQINKITGDTGTATERIATHGGSANVNDATPISTRKINDAFAELQDSVTLLKNTFVNTFEPVIIKISSALAGLADWLTKRFFLASGDAKEERKEQLEDTKNKIDVVNELIEKKILPNRAISVGFGYLDDEGKERKAYKKNSARTVDSSKLNAARNSKNLYDQFNGYVASSPFYGTDLGYEAFSEPYALEWLARKNAKVVGLRKEMTASGQTVVPVGGGNLDKELAMALYRVIGDVDKVNGLTAEERAAILMSNDYQEIVDFKKNYFSQGKEYDFKEDAPFELANDLKRVLGEEYAVAAMMKALEKIGSMKGQSMISGTSKKFDEERGEVHFYIHTTNIGREEVFEHTYKLGTSAKEIIKNDLVP